MTTAEQITFELSLWGVNIASPRPFKVPELQLTAQLKPGAPLRLKVRVIDVSEQDAEAHANKFARTLYRQFLLKFGGHIECSEPLRTIQNGKAFAVVPPARPPVILSQSEIDDVAKDVALRVITPEVATSAQLYVAIDMYAAGLESQNKVVRFLVFYSALALAGLFKDGRGGGRQQNVDRLIRERNPSISVSASPTKQNVTETLYTKLRNDLIHAEERGCDPAGAIAAIEKHIEQFQRDVSLVFSQL